MSLLAKVWRQRFWMIKLGSRTPKSSLLLWSNSENVGVFRTGILRRQRLQRKQPQLVKRYRDSSGRQRFSGIRKNLKKSGIHGIIQWFFPFGNHIRIFRVIFHFYWQFIRAFLGPTLWASHWNTWNILKISRRRLAVFANRWWCRHGTFGCNIIEYTYMPLGSG